MAKKHIVIDARIRRSSTGRPVDRLLHYLQNIDHENRYTVFVQPGDDWKPSAKNFSVTPCRFKQFSLNPIQQLLFSEWLYRLKPDLVHFTLTGSQPLFYFGKQMTFTHDLTMFKYARPGRLPRWVHWLRMQGYRLLMWSAHKRAVITHTPTEYVKDAVNKKYLSTNRRTFVTYEAAEPASKVKELKPDVDVEDFIMYVGSAFPHKNLHRLVDAFLILKNRHPDLKLVLVGRIEKYARSLRRYVKKQRSNHDIIFTGFLTDSEVKWLYKHAKAYTFASLSEGFGLPPLEAMANGCPVVTSNASCIPEVCGEAVMYFDPENTQEMSEMIHKVIASEKTRKRLSIAGRKQAAKYSWERMTREIHGLYNQALEI